MLNQTLLTSVEAIEISGTFLTLASIVVLAIVFVIMIELETKEQIVVKVEQIGKEKAWPNSYNTKSQPFHVVKIFIGFFELANCSKSLKAMVAPIEVLKPNNVFMKPSSIFVLFHGLVFG